MRLIAKILEPQGLFSAGVIILIFSLILWLLICIIAPIAPVVNYAVLEAIPLVISLRFILALAINSYRSIHFSSPAQGLIEHLFSIRRTVRKIYPKNANGTMHEPTPTSHKAIDSDIFHPSTLFIC
jgi:dolichyl-phosphate-mannose--protein O-mannosyl transferase